jgi:hypothetical protein
MSEENPPELMQEENLPFIIEPFTKEERLKERESRPKLGLRRLT